MLPCHCMHHIVAYCHVLFMFGVSFVIGSASEDNPEYPSEGRYPTTTPSGKQNPLVHSDTIPLSRSCSLLLHWDNNDSFVTCCGSWTPLSSAWPVIATVNRWNPLAWVGVVWAQMCLLIHARLSCLLLLRVESGLIHRGWIRIVMNMTYIVWTKCVNMIW